MGALEESIQKLKSATSLTVQEAEEDFTRILSGRVDEKSLIQYLILLRDKGETAEEIKGAVLALQKKALRLPITVSGAIDTCGTGGDQKNTFNISTAAAFVVAGAGIRVAKHGNRAVSSQTGSADLLKACGVNVDASPKIMGRCVDKIGIGFCFAPLYHSALKTVASARQKISTKTIFNILGPLLNPAGVKRQVIGVYDIRLVYLLPQVLKELGSESAAVVHGRDGLDEVTLTTTTAISFLNEGGISEEEFDPRLVGYPYCRLEDLRGGTAEENAHRLRKMLKGHSQPIDHCVHLNAALAIRISGKTADMREALLIAQESISSGKAYEKLEALVEMTNELSLRTK